MVDEQSLEFLRVESIFSLEIEAGKKDTAVFGHEMSQQIARSMIKSPFGRSFCKVPPPVVTVAPDTRRDHNCRALSASGIWFTCPHM